ncbi:hypothetical protein EIP86_009471 [Pleurotus ostreatoroseus]|nr:hypothetical protein EIP86_009471 [Pleurotus ostreatoroseus]
MSGMQVEGISPPWHLHLSHSPLLEDSLPDNPVLPLFLKCPDTERPFTVKHDAQAVFCWFRRAGPLVSIRLNVDVGYEDSACVIQYWDKSYADFARKMGIRTIKQGKADAFAFVSFSTIEEGKIVEALCSRSRITLICVRYAAREARCHMHGRKLGGNEIRIRYYEPKAQSKAHPQPGARVTTILFATSGKQSRASVRSIFFLLLRVISHLIVEKTPEPPPPNTERFDAINIAKATRIRAEVMEKLAASQEAKAILHEQEKSREFEFAQQSEMRAREALEQVKLALQEAQRAVALAETRVFEATQLVDLASSEKAKALAELSAAMDNIYEARWKADEARGNKKSALREERKLRGLSPNDEGDTETETQRVESTDASDSEASYDDAGPNDDNDDDLRKAELEESRRKMEELRKQEEADQLEREARAREAELRESLHKMAQFEAEEKRRKQEREETEKRAREAAKRAKEECERREREEAARKAREQREKEEREKKEIEERLERYRSAVASEKMRCKLRDQAHWEQGSPWTPSKSIERFRLVSNEFDELKFSDTQPLTFESVPWPTLLSPYTLRPDDIDWQIVERFFEKLQLTVTVEEYKILVEKAHRRFHPDKWRSKGLLNTILEGDVRDMIERAGNVVAQALTPIWLKSRQRG